MGAMWSLSQNIVNEVQVSSILSCVTASVRPHSWSESGEQNLNQGENPKNTQTLREMEISFAQI